MHFIDGRAQFRFRVTVLGSLRHRNAMLVGQDLESLEKADALEFHHELEHIAFSVATETLVVLMRAMHSKRGRSLLMERA